MEGHSKSICEPRKEASTAAAAAKSLQLCPTLCDPIDGSPPVSSVHGIFQARVLEWGAIAFSGNCYFPNNFIWKVTQTRGRWLGWTGDKPGISYSVVESSMEK